MTIHSEITLGPVSLRITDLDQSISFYRDLLGLTVLEQTGNTATLGAKMTPLVVLEEQKDARRLAPNSVAGLYHFAILLPSRKELGFVIRNLISNDVDLGQGDHLVSEAFYLSDPDGNGIEIYADRPRETWSYEANGDVKMTTDPVDWQSMLVEAGEEDWYGMPADTVMGHVHFHVKSLEAGRAKGTGRRRRTGLLDARLSKCIRVRKSGCCDRCFALPSRADGRRGVRHG
ncbi:VOC family protein [Exiguobacterium sp. s80]|uniref:VOC family protein n=1 Tax=Exiguobacterium sp. s80 TaxID=2751209 RepID=UPI002036C30B|nr:VOC family protein [Exiguobacterium sp. s80]